MSRYLTKSPHTKEETCPGTKQTETRTASFEYDLQSTRKSGLLQRELAQGSAGPALRTLHDLDDYGNRVATWVCSDLNPDGSARTDAQCRDASRVRHQLTDASGAPTISVHRYTRTQYDTIGRYPVRTRVPYFNGATSGNDVIERTSSEVISRDVFGNPTEGMRPATTPTAAPSGVLSLSR